jgi:hypothetical protein
MRCAGSSIGIGRLAMADTRENVNRAPYPDELKTLVDACTYRPGWRVHLTTPDYDRGQGSSGLTLIITTRTVDTYNPDEPIRVNHLFPVPPASYDRRSWQRWLFNQFLLVEQHECQEFFQIRDDRLIQVEDECAECEHQATLHDGRDSSCNPQRHNSKHETFEPCAAGKHRFEPAKPRYARPYAPSHGPGNDPYMIREYGTDLDRRTKFTGEVDDG